MRRIVSVAAGAAVVIVVIVIYWRHERTAPLRYVFGPYCGYVKVLKQRHFGSFLQSDPGAQYLLLMNREKYVEFVSSDIGEKYDFERFETPGAIESAVRSDLVWNLVTQMEFVSEVYGEKMDHRFVVGYVIDKPNPVFPVTRITLIELEGGDKSMVRLGLNM